jgi:hypothetical protein
MSDNPSPPRTLKEDIQDLQMWARYEGPFTERYPATRDRVERLVNAYEALEHQLALAREGLEMIANEAGSPTMSYEPAIERKELLVSRNLIARLAQQTLAKLAEPK